MPSRWRPLPSRGCCVAALFLLARVALAADPPATAPTAEATTGPTSRPDRQMPPAVDSLDAVRLDRRMTLFQPGPAVEPAPRPGQQLDPAAEFWVELPSHRDLVADLARRLGLPTPTVRLLPEASRASSRHGMVRIDHAILRTTPGDRPGDHENLSDALRGEPVWILDQDASGTSLLVHAVDGYLGWADASAISAIDERMFTSAINAGRNEAGAGRVERVLAAARERLGTRYVWGGKTGDGIDCSGLAQTAFATAGVALPRDADQQSIVGRLVATRWDTDALLPGDLMFYVGPRRGTVIHVAIYLGHGEYIEAAGADVHISSMTPGAPNYDAKRAATFGWARRVIE